MAFTNKTCCNLVVFAKTSLGGWDSFSGAETCLVGHGRERHAACGIYIENESRKQQNAANKHY